MAKQRFTTSINEDVLRKIKIQAINENVSLSELFERIIKNYLDEQEKPRK